MSNIEPKVVNKLREKKRKREMKARLKKHNQKNGIKSLPAAILGMIFVVYFGFKFVYILMDFEGLPPTKGFFQLFWFALFENLLFIFSGILLLIHGMSMSNND